MASLLRIPASLASVQARIDDGLARVRKRFDEQLASDLPPVSRLAAHVEHYRGKMLRPTLVLASGLAAAGRDDALAESHVTIAAVVEMVHMATLVHDDVLDEADRRRGGATVNRLFGNESAVILGDYLIASAYHLCSQLDSQAAALLIGGVSMTTCAGELLQLDHRGDFSLDEPTYFEIVERKTASLIAASCRLGAWCSGADEGDCRALERFGRDLGVAFQVRDDVLDLAGDEGVMGKRRGMDLHAGKLTLPVIHHLAACSPVERGRSLLLLERAGGADGDACREAAARLVDRLASTGSIDESLRCAANLVERARGALAGLREGPARLYLHALADAVVSRAR